MMLSGHTITHCVPVYEGHPLNHGIKTVKVGGRDVEDHLVKLLAKKGHNYKVYDNGTLEFAGIEKQDEADYKCKAKNLYGVAESDEVEVVVEAAAEIKEFPENTEVAEGEKLELQCAATGDPPPIISWLKNGQQVSF